jgi:CelD/BcsL family acetyltransferase involved in cellulose biosynthesis
MMKVAVDALRRAEQLVFETFDFVIDDEQYKHNIPAWTSQKTDSSEKRSEDTKQVHW